MCWDDYEMSLNMCITSNFAIGIEVEEVEASCGGYYFIWLLL
jgi:hypothetical protein